MVNSNSPIGIIDSGIGGLTVMKKLKRLFPNEDIVYFGDSANCPYGERNTEEIIALARDMFDFMRTQDVKAVAIACNTISTQITRFSSYQYPIVGIIAPASEMIASSQAIKVGLLATPFTIKTGEYKRLIHLSNPSIEIFGEANLNLAALIDSGEFNYPLIDKEIINSIELIIKHGAPDYIILGCTHYPIVMDRFRKLFPDMVFVNPALEQANSVMQTLKCKGMNSTEDKIGKFTLCTSGHPAAALEAIEILGIDSPDEIKIINLQRQGKVSSKIRK